MRRPDWRPWYRAGKEAFFGDSAVLAGGMALFALLATIPMLAAIAAVYSLGSDPSRISAQLNGLERVLPYDVVQFLSRQLERMSRRSTHLGIAVGTTVAVAIWSANRAARALIVGLNRAYRVEETRPWIRRSLLGLAVAAATLLGCIVFAIVLVALPTLLHLLRVRGHANTLAYALRWPVLLVLVACALAILYKFAPARPARQAKRIWPGAVAATSLWLVVSWGLTVYVDQVANYEILYGAFASVLVLITWFYLTATAILLGGNINAELER
jgi:membrane protein